MSVFYDYPWFDVPDVGATVQVMTNGDQELVDRSAEDMDEFLWRVRQEFAIGQYPFPSLAAELVRESIASRRVPDSSDALGRPQGYTPAP